MKNNDKCKVSILGQSYQLTVDDDSHAQVQKAALEVDELMSSICKEAPHLSRYEVAILAAMRLSSKLFVKEKDCEAIREKISQFNSFIDEAIPSH
ncbi:MAG: cell division protein ZapA [Candidatus Babeliales bacterium]